MVESKVDNSVFVYNHDFKKQIVRLVSGLRILDNFTEIPIIITSYLPTYQRGPYGGIEKLKQVRLGMSSQPVIVLSFESREGLLTIPDNQILDEAGTYHFRLPFTTSKFGDFLGFLKPVSVENIGEVVQRSCTIHGQLDSFLERLLRDLEVSQKNIILIYQKIQNLQRFCSRNCGTWFDNLITHGQENIRQNNFESASEVLNAMKKHIAAVFVYYAFEKFSHGKAFDIVNEGLGPLRAILVSVNAGTISRDHILNYLNSSRSLQNLIQKMVSLLRDLKTLLGSSLSVPYDLEQQTKKFIDSLTVLRSNLSLEFLDKDADVLVDAIDNIVTATDDIINRGILTKDYLSTWNLKKKV